MSKQKSIASLIVPAFASARRQSGLLATPRIRCGAHSLHERLTVAFRWSAGTPRLVVALPGGLVRA